MADNRSMEGMTISEMAKKLKVPRKTVEMRILRGGYKPLTKEAVYSADVFEAIKKSPGRGRPSKSTKDEKAP
jgi:DNA-binding XRE family transcriptional regulator